MWVSEAVWWDKWELWWILGRGGHSWERLQAAGMLSSLLSPANMKACHLMCWKLFVFTCNVWKRWSVCVSEGERESVYSELLVLFMRSAGLEECECLLSRLTSLGKREGRRPADAHAHTHTLIRALSDKHLQSALPLLCLLGRKCCCSDGCWYCWLDTHPPYSVFFLPSMPIVPVYQITVHSALMELGLLKAGLL